MEVGYSTPQLKALIWCLRRALSALTTSMSMMSKRTRISPSGELTASQNDAAISRSLRGILPLAVLGCGDVDEDQSALVVGTQIDLGSNGGSPTGLEKLVSLTLDEAGGCLDCLFLKFEITHDGLRLFVAGPFGLPCDPEAAQVLAEGKESSENPAGPEFCAAKVFRALPEEPGSERAWRSQGKAKEDVPAGERVLCNIFGVAG